MAGCTVRIGVARDQVFCFYSRDILEVCEAAGAKLVKFSPLNSQVLPDVDKLYLGGGYLELHGGFDRGRRSGDGDEAGETSFSKGHQGANGCGVLAGC